MSSLNKNKIKAKFLAHQFWRLCRDKQIFFYLISVHENWKIIFSSLIKSL